MALLSQRFRSIYRLRVSQKQVFRLIKWYLNDKRYSRTIADGNLEYPVIDHRSLLVRRLGDSDPRLQYNKITNLKMAANQLNGVLIKPGETFSFWRLVGNATRGKGYLDGLCLVQGQARPGVGGGLCQLSNLLYWMVLHTPLVVVERHRHSFDPFPDCERVIPFGTGATIFYNYIDLQFTNPTTQTFQIEISFDDTYVKGKILSDTPLRISYRVFEQNHRFVMIDDKYYRGNEIWRETYMDGVKQQEELLFTNFCTVKYQLNNDQLRLVVDKP